MSNDRRTSMTVLYSTMVCQHSLCMVTDRQSVYTLLWIESVKRWVMVGRCAADSVSPVRLSFCFVQVRGAGPESEPARTARRES